MQGIIRALKTDFPELRIKEYHGKSDPMEKAYDFRNVKESWKDADLVAYTVKPQCTDTLCTDNSLHR